jgi:D-sedoheptulose 7-phosphate isomerase
MKQTDPQFVADWLARSAATTAAFAADPAATATLLEISGTIADALRQGGKLLIAGNGGSAADAQHIAAEFVSRMNYDRAPLAAIALTTDTSALTATGNDYGFEQVFSRQVQALGRPGDVMLGISTSCSSPNVVAALKAARGLGLKTVGFAGAGDGPMSPWCDHMLRAPSPVTAIAQQVHIIAAHIVCSLVERALCPRADA